MSKKLLLWLDLEMTGLDEKKDSILEIATVATDLDLSPLKEYSSVVYQSQSVLENMNDWCKEQHGKSGLTARVPQGKKLEEVEDDLLKLIDELYDSQTKVVIAGNSIWNDRKFIDAYLPRFSSRLHYRMVDVSSYKEIYREKFGLKYDKKNAHRAMGDIFESIEEFKFYLGFIHVHK